MLLRVMKKNPTHAVAVFDAPGKSFRSELYPEYKANRPPTPPELREQIPVCMEMTRLMGIPTLSIPGVESDDVIATLTTKARSRGFTVTIVSSDKDLMALVGEGVVMWDTMKDLVYTPEEVEKKYGVPPNSITDLLALMGDSSDNVPGVPGIGPKTAAKLLQKYGNIDRLLQSIALIKGKAGKNLKKHRDTLLLSRKLVQLKHDVELEEDLEELTALAPPDSSRLRKLFETLSFRQLIRELENLGWLNSDKDTDTEESGYTPAPTISPVPAIKLSSVTRDKLDSLSTPIAVAIYPDTDLLHETDIAGIMVCGSNDIPLYAPVASNSGIFSVTTDQQNSLDVLEELLSADSDKTIHHHKEALVLLGRRGKQLNGTVFDPMIAAYLLDPSRLSYSICSLAHMELGLEFESCHKIRGRGKKRMSHSELPEEIVLRCAGHEGAALHALEHHLFTRINSDPKLKKLYYDIELPLTDVLARMELAGVLVDLRKLNSLGLEIQQRLHEIEDNITQLAGGPINLNSPKQLAKFFFEDMGLPVIKRGKTGPSTDAHVLEVLANRGFEPAVLVHEHRTLSKLKSGYINTLPKLVNPITGRIHTTFNQAVAATGRLSSSNPNLQNIPVRTEIGRRIRDAFIAPPGYRLLSLDYSQIELRVLAHLSGDRNLIEAFQSGEDVHSRTALELFGEVDDEKRRIAKAVNFGVVYGQTPFGLQRALGIPMEEARQYINRYFERYPGVQDYMNRIIDEVREKGYAETILGRRRPIHLTRKGSHEERTARNTPIQGSAADIIKLAMLRVDEYLKKNIPQVTMILTVHDELIFEVPENMVESVASQLIPIMEGVLELSVPLRVEAGYGRTWAQAH